MPMLLLKVQGLRMYNFSLFAPTLFLYDDFIIYRRRHWLIVREMTISYKQIAQVNLHKILYLTHLTIKSTGTDDITVKFLYTPQAIRAKKIIDQKIHLAHRLFSRKVDKQMEKASKKIHGFERSVNRLRELLHKGYISEREYKKRKKRLLKKLH